MLYQIKAGTTDVSVVIRIVDAADGTPETGVEHNTSGIALQYRREGAASTSITEAALAALTTSHTDGGIEHIGNGYYRLDLPDAACASGAPGVLVHGTVTDMVVIGCYVQLITVDLFDTVRMGLTALPNVVSGNAGALITAGTGTGQLSVSSGLVGLIDNAITAAKVAADAIGASELAADAASEIATAVWAAVTRTLTAGTNIALAKGTGVTGFNDLSAAQVNAEVDTALADYDPPTKTELDSAVSPLATAANLATVDTVVDDIAANVIRHMAAFGIWKLERTETTITAYGSDKTTVTDTWTIDDTDAPTEIVNDA